MKKQLAILESALNPKRFPVMLDKLSRRMTRKKAGLSQQAYMQWLSDEGVSVEEWCKSRDEGLWEEAVSFKDALVEAYKERRDKLPPEIGGSGNACFNFLYFLTRYFKPQTVVETGVALGFSSQAFLKALDLNGQGGRLYSSDFPYFRVHNAESYIGFMVEDAYRPFWTLYVDGDDSNLRRIRDGVGSIDLFHYDSDKSYIGRMKGFAAVQDKLAPDALILFDDLRDNPHFYDFVQQKMFKNYVVFDYKGQFVGMVTNRDV